MDRRHALVFTASGKPFTVERTRLGRDVTARWFGPTTGQETRLEPTLFRGGDLPQLKPPAQTPRATPDWVLVLGRLDGFTPQPSGPN